MFEILKLNLLRVDLPVSSPIAKMYQPIANGAALMLEYFLAVFLAFRGFTECYRDGIEILSTGLMFGSGAVMPPLSPESLDLRGLYKAYFVTLLLHNPLLTAGSMMAFWALASITFMWLNRIELAA